MSLVVRIVGHAMLVPALLPMYGIPCATLFRICSTRPNSCNVFSNRNEFPPPTKIPFADASFQFVALNQVLGASESARAVLAEAVRVLSREGRLIVFDRVQPTVTRLSAQATNELAENRLSVWLSELGCRISQRRWFPGRVMEYAMFTAVKSQTG